MIIISIQNEGGHVPGKDRQMVSIFLEVQGHAK